jgi:hypothetical protein
MRIGGIIMRRLSRFKDNFNVTPGWVVLISFIFTIIPVIILVSNYDYNRMYLSRSIFNKRYMDMDYNIFHFLLVWLVLFLVGMSIRFLVLLIQDVFISIKESIKNQKPKKQWEKLHKGYIFCDRCEGTGTIEHTKILKEAEYEYRTSTRYTGSYCTSCSSGSYDGSYCSGCEQTEKVEVSPALTENIIEPCKYCDGFGGIKREKWVVASLLGRLKTAIIHLTNIFV